MKKKIAILLAALLLLSCFAACSTSCSRKRRTDPLIGTWIYEQTYAIYAVTFQKNGTVTVEFENTLYGNRETFEYAYTAKDGKITVEERNFTGDYTIEGDTLTVTVGSSSFVLTRKIDNPSLIPGTPDPAAALIGTWVQELDGEVDIISFREKGVVVSRTIVPGSGIDWTSEHFYEVKDGQIFINERGVDYRVEGDKLTLVLDGEDYVLTRNDGAAVLLEATPRPVAEETDPRELLIGTWVYEEGEGDSVLKTTLEFRRDGKVIMTWFYNGSVLSTQENTYTADSSTITVDGDAGSYRIRDGVLTLSYDGTEMELTRQ